MPDKNFYSDEDLWIDTANSYFNNYSISYIDSLLRGLSAAQKVNELLSSKLPGMPTSINLGITESQVRRFGERFMILKSFADSIHYEAAEWIDIPFSQEVGKTAEAAYEIDPKKFRPTEKYSTNKASKGIFATNAFDYLTKLAPDDSKLKKDLKKKIKSLNRDKMSNEINDVIKDASFWAKEFDRAEKIRDLETEFKAKYGDNWDQMSEDERETALKEYAISVGKLYKDPVDDAGINAIIKALTPNVVSGMEITDEDVYGYTHPGSQDKKVYVNRNYLKNSDSGEENLSFNLDSALNTINHESRHQFQGEVIQGKGHHGASSKYKQDMTDSLNSYDEPTTDYWTTPVETDARAYAALCHI